MEHIVYIVANVVWFYVGNIQVLNAPTADIVKKEWELPLIKLEDFK